MKAVVWPSYPQKILPLLDHLGLYTLCIIVFPLSCMYNPFFKLRYTVRFLFLFQAIISWGSGIHFPSPPCKKVLEAYILIRDMLVNKPPGVLVEGASEPLPVPNFQCSYCVVRHSKMCRLSAISLQINSLG